MSNIDKRPNRADGGDIGTGRIREIADNPYGDEEKCWLAKRVLTLLDELEAKEGRIAEFPGQKRLIGWRMADYTNETADPKLAKNWATAVDVLPIFEGDVNTKLSAAAAVKGE